MGDWRTGQALGVGGKWRQWVMGGKGRHGERRTGEMLGLGGQGRRGQVRAGVAWGWAGREGVGK